MALLQSPHKRTVFLDVDNTACASLLPALAFLDHYDLAMTPEASDLAEMKAPARHKNDKQQA